MAELVAPAHRPTLADLLRPRLGTRRLRGLGAVGAVLALALVAWVALRTDDPGIRLVDRGAPTFNLRYDPGALRAVAPRRGERLRLEGRRGGLFLQSFAVLPLAVAPFRGDVGGALPVMAAQAIDGLRRRYAEFELVEDGKARINQVPAYSIVFRARQGERRLLGRAILLPEPVPAPRRGLSLELLATPAAGVSRATEVGVRGATKLPYRSLRFGTEGP